MSVLRHRQTTESQHHRETAWETWRVRCTGQSARTPLILNGEMSEWLKEHAWKTIPASGIESYRNIAKEPDGRVQKLDLDQPGHQRRLYVMSTRLNSPYVNSPLGSSHRASPNDMSRTVPKSR